MTKITNATEDEAAKLALEGDAIILGGVCRQCWIGDNPVLTPCLKSGCDWWKEGEWFYIREAGDQRIRVLLALAGFSIDKHPHHRHS